MIAKKDFISSKRTLYVFMKEKIQKTLFELFELRIRNSYPTDVLHVYLNN